VTWLADLVAEWIDADHLVAVWAANPHQIHKRPPYRAHNFDDDDRYWVVGTTTISVLPGWSGRGDLAQAVADALNAAVAARAAAPESDVG